MNKIITNLIQIAYDIMKNEPNFIEIDKKLTQIEKEMNIVVYINKNASEEDKVKIQEQISSMLDMQNAFLELRRSGKDINWNDFLNSKQAGKVFDDLIKNIENNKDLKDYIVTKAIFPKKKYLIYLELMAKRLMYPLKQR